MLSMLSILIILIISWGILRTQNETLNVLGFLPNVSRSKDLVLGFLLSAVAAIIYFLCSTILMNSEIDLNSEYSMFSFFEGTWWTLRSVLFEELIFRGALLYLLIRNFGAKKGILISSIAFGIIHWFSYNIFGNLTEMIWVFLLTGISGIVFAYAYYLTGSLYLPIALHFGWNLISINIFSQGPVGDQLLIISTTNEAGLYQSLFFFLYQICVFPLIILIWHFRKDSSKFGFNQHEYLQSKKV